MYLSIVILRSLINFGLQLGFGEKTRLQKYYRKPRRFDPQNRIKMAFFAKKHVFSTEIIREKKASYFFRKIQKILIKKLEKNGQIETGMFFLFQG